MVTITFLLFCFAKINQQFLWRLIIYGFMFMFTMLYVSMQISYCSYSTTWSNHAPRIAFQRPLAGILKINSKIWFFRFPSFCVHWFMTWHGGMVESWVESCGMVRKMIERTRIKRSFLLKLDDDSCLKFGATNVLISLLEEISVLLKMRLFYFFWQLVNKKNGGQSDIKITCLF